MKGKISLFITCLLLFSCSREASKTDENIRYRYFNLQNSGWKSKQYKQVVGNLSFKAAEVPIAYYMLQSEGSQDLFKIDSLEKANNNERIIEFEFSQEEEKDVLSESLTGIDYAQAVKYMSFDILKDFSAVTSKGDTVQCSGVLFERNFKIAPQSKLLLFFSGIPKNQSIQLVYNDCLYKKGLLKFKFEDKITKILL